MLRAQFPAMYGFGGWPRCSTTGTTRKSASLLAIGSSTPCFLSCSSHCRAQSCACYAPAGGRRMLPMTRAWLCRKGSSASAKPLLYGSPGPLSQHAPAASAATLLQPSWPHRPQHLPSAPTRCALQKQTPPHPTPSPCCRASMRTAGRVCCHRTNYHEGG